MSAVHKHTQENQALERELDVALKSIKDHRRLHQQLESDLAASQQAQFDLISQVDSLEQALRELKHSAGLWSFEQTGQNRTGGHQQHGLCVSSKEKEREGEGEEDKTN